MEINKTNYEIWFIDWLDGNLSDAQVEQMTRFLNGNPDLKEEFEELRKDSILCVSAYDIFLYKEQLKKSTSDIILSQFEYLCVAYLENDLSISQQTELMKIINVDTDKKKTFKLIQKTRISASAITYKHKSLMLKRTAAQSIIRLSLIGLSAAAVIVFIIINYIIIPRNTSDPIRTQAQNIVADSTLRNPYSDVVSDKALNSDNPVPAKQVNIKRVKGIKKINPSKFNSELVAALPRESLVRITGNFEIMPEKISFNSLINLQELNIDNKLIASALKIEGPHREDTRSNIGRFLAKTFREKILKENTKLDTPLRGYEIAEAGITGLNKLLGWEMALKENNDGNGTLKSVYFSSKILKFNAPVK